MTTYLLTTVARAIQYVVNNPSKANLSEDEYTLYLQPTPRSLPWGLSSSLMGSATVATVSVSRKAGWIRYPIRLTPAKGNKGVKNETIA